MLFASFCKRTVLPVLGAATMRPRCPMPMGVNISMTRIEISEGSTSSLIRLFG